VAGRAEASEIDRRLLDAVDALVLVLDAEGRVVRMNRACELVSGHSEADVIGCLAREVVFDGDPGTDRRFEGGRSPAGASAFEHSLRTRDGELRQMKWTLRPLEDGAGGRQWIVTGVDVTEQRRDQAALEEATREVERLRSLYVRRSDDRFRFLADQLPVGVVLTRLDSPHVLYANPAARHLVGDDSMGGGRMPRFFWERGQRERILAELGRRGSVHRESFPVRLPDGTRIAVEFSGRRVEFDGDEAFLAVGWQVGDEPEKAESLRTRTDLIDRIHDALFTLDLDYRVTSWNRSAELLYGYSAEEAAGREIGFLCPAFAELGARPEALFEQGLYTSRSEVVTKPGDRVEVELSLTLIRDRGGVPVAIVGQSFDLTGRESAKAVLQHDYEARNAEQRAFSARLLARQDAERERLARELHDGPVQTLAAAMLALSTLLERGSELSASSREMLLFVTDTLRDSVAELRRVGRGLSPELLDTLGLPGAIQRLAESFRASGAVLNVELEELPRLLPGAEVTLFRVIQEALRNAERHSRARGVTVRVEALEDRVIASVTDDGVGFQLEDVLSRGRADGLRGMRERVASLQGKFSVRTTPGGGCRVEAEIPLTLAR